MRIRRRLSFSVVLFGLALAALTPATAEAASWTSVPAPWAIAATDAGTPVSIARVPRTHMVWTSGYFGGGHLPFNENTGSGWVTNPFPGAPTGVDPTSSYYTSITGVVSGQLFSVGFHHRPHLYRSQAATWNGSSWAPVHTDQPGDDTFLVGVGASSPTTIWALGSFDNASVEPQPFTIWPLIEKYDPGRGFKIARIFPLCTGCQESFGVPARVPRTHDLWAGGVFAPSTSRALYMPVIERYAHGRWGRPERFPALATDGTTAGSVAAAGRADAWDVGGRQMLRWNGRSWRIVTPPAVVGQLDDVTRIPDTRHYWAVGMQPDGSSLALFWNGRSWKTIPTPDIGELTSVAAVSKSDAWAVSSTGALRYHP